MIVFFLRKINSPLIFLYHFNGASWYKEMHNKLNILKNLTCFFKIIEKVFFFLNQSYVCWCKKLLNAPTLLKITLSSRTNLTLFQQLYFSVQLRSRKQIRNLDAAFVVSTMAVTAPVKLKSDLLCHSFTLFSNKFIACSFIVICLNLNFTILSQLVKNSHLIFPLNKHS